MEQKSSQPDPQPTPHFDEGVPARLREDLQGLYGQTPGVPAGLDAGILALARAHHAARRQRQWRIWTGGVGTAAAAGLLLAAWLALRPVEYHRRGDILDAFYLARQIKAGSTVDKQWDINGDGLVNTYDVEALAASAVEVKHLDSGSSKTGGTL